jgi:hypothetical protein
MTAATTIVDQPGRFQSVAPSRTFWRVLWLGVLLFGALYVGLRCSPSSYAIVLRSLGESDDGVMAFMPRPERGDEFAWQTPLLQMTIRSGFQRFDKTAPYFEDLRSLYGMPISTGRSFSSRSSGCSSSPRRTSRTPSTTFC